MRYSHITLVVILALVVNLRSSSVSTSMDSDLKDVSADNQQQTLRLVFSKNSIYRDPRHIDQGNRDTTELLTSDGLVRRQPDGKIVPSLAENYTMSEDGKTYLFTIKNCAVWSDGKEVTADDFERSWTLYLETEAGAKYSKCFASEHSADHYDINPRDRFMITALDKKRLRVILSKPKEDFLQLLLLPGFMLYRDRELNESNIMTDSSFHIPVCGPFTKLKVEDNTCIFEKNPSYWDKENVKIDRVEVDLVDSPRSSLDLFLENQIDFVSYPLGEIDCTTLRNSDTSRKNVVLNTEQANITFWVELNTDSQFLKSIALRQAISHAVNRSEIAWKLGAHKFKPSLTFLPTASQINPRFFPLNSKTQAAQACLEEALEELEIEREELELELLTTHNDSFPSLSHYFASSVEENLGIRIKTTVLPTQEYLKRVKEKDFDLICFHWAGYSTDPAAFLRPFRYTNPELYQVNYSAWHNLNFVELYDRAQQCQSKHLRKKLLSEAERILHDELPIIPLLECSTDWLQNPKLKGFVISEPNIIDFRWAYFTSSDSSQ